MTEASGPMRALMPSFSAEELAAREALVAAVPVGTTVEFRDGTRMTRE